MFLFCFFSCSIALNYRCVYFELDWNGAKLAIVLPLLLGLWFISSIPLFIADIAANYFYFSRSPSPFSFFHSFASRFGSLSPFLSFPRSLTTRSPFQSRFLFINRIYKWKRRAHFVCSYLHGMKVSAHLHGESQTNSGRQGEETVDCYCWCWRCCWWCVCMLTIIAAIFSFSFCSVFRLFFSLLLFAQYSIWYSFQLHCDSADMPSVCCLAMNNVRAADLFTFFFYRSLCLSFRNIEFHGIKLSASIHFMPATNFWFSLFDIVMMDIACMLTPKNTQKSMLLATNPAITFTQTKISVLSFSFHVCTEDANGSYTVFIAWLLRNLNRLSYFSIYFVLFSLSVWQPTKNKSLLSFDFWLK